MKAHPQHNSFHHSFQNTMVHVKRKAINMRIPISTQVYLNAQAKDN